MEIDENIRSENLYTWEEMKFSTLVFIQIENHWSALREVN